MSNQVKIISLGLFAALALSACGGGGSTVTPNTNASGTTITSVGGTVTGPDGVQVTVPAGALPADTKITITKTSVGAPQFGLEGAVDGTVYQIEPHNVTFKEPVTIRLPAPAGQTDAVVYVAETGTGWYPHKATVKDGFVELQRTEFSWYRSWYTTTNFVYTATRGIEDKQVEVTETIDFEVDFGQNQKFIGKRQYQATQGTWVMKQNVPIEVEFAAFDANGFITTNYGTINTSTCANPKVGSMIRVGDLRNADGTPVWLVLPSTAMETVNFTRPGWFGNTTAHSRSVVRYNFTPPVPGSGQLYYYLICDGKEEPRTALLGIKVNFTILPTYSLKGSVTGLPSGSTVGLTNAGKTLTMGNSDFEFKALDGGSAYNVGIAPGSVPDGYKCEVSSGTGTIASSDVNGVTVTCSELPPFTVGGTVSGLTNGNFDIAQLQLGSETLNRRNGAFTFVTGVRQGQSYAVSIPSQGPSECKITGGTGTIAADGLSITGIMPAANISNIAVTCTQPVGSGPFKVSGTVSGLMAGYSMTVSMGSETINVTDTNPNFEFTTKVNAGASYSVEASDATSSQNGAPILTCTGAGSGTANADVTLAINCMPAGGPGGGPGGPPGGP